MWALDDGNVDSVVLGDGFLDGQDGWDGATMGVVQEFVFLTNEAGSKETLNKHIVVCTVFLLWIETVLSTIYIIADTVVGKMHILVTRIKQGRC